MLLNISEICLSVDISRIYAKVKYSLLIVFEYGIKQKAPTIGHYKIFCVNGNTGFKFESRIFNFIHLQNEEDYERKESSSA